MLVEVVDVGCEGSEVSNEGAAADKTAVGIARSGYLCRLEVGLEWIEVGEESLKQAEGK